MMLQAGSERHTSIAALLELPKREVTNQETAGEQVGIINPDLRLGRAGDLTLIPLSSSQKISRDELPDCDSRCL